MNSLDAPVHDDYSPDGAQFGAVVERRTEAAITLQPDRPLPVASPTPRLIALCSPAMGSGKSVIAHHLVAVHGFVLLKFAGPLKAMTRALFAELGDDATTIEDRVEGGLKEIYVHALRHTPRYVMQRLGTEFGRDCLHPDVWADIVKERAQKYLAAGQSVVIDDMRYLNEAEAVRSVGGYCIRVVRLGAHITSSHSSEGGLDKVGMLSIDNSGTIDQLRRYADTLATCPLR